MTHTNKWHLKSVQLLNTYQHIAFSTNMGYTLHKKLVTRFQFGNKRQSFVHIKKLFSQMQIYIYSIGVLTVNI